MAAVEGAPGAAVRGGEVEGRVGGVDESGNALVLPVVEEAEYGGRRPVELVEAAAEAGVGDGAAPGLGGEGGAEEGPRFGGREAEEDLRDEVERQFAAGPLMRFHGGGWLWPLASGLWVSLEWVYYGRNTCCVVL